MPGGAAALYKLKNDKYIYRGERQDEKGIGSAIDCLYLLYSISNTDHDDDNDFSNEHNDRDRAQNGDTSKAGLTKES